LTHLRPLLLQLLDGDGDDGLQFLGEQRDPQFLDHPAVEVQFWIGPALLRMLMKVVEVSLPEGLDHLRHLLFAPEAAVGELLQPQLDAPEVARQVDEPLLGRPHDKAPVDEVGELVGHVVDGRHPWRRVAPGELQGERLAHVQ
jgi:hypothetical protein